MRLICDLQEELTEEILAQITSALVCTEIDNLIVNLNNNSVFSIIKVKYFLKMYQVDGGLRCFDFWAA